MILYWINNRYVRDNVQRGSPINFQKELDATAAVLVRMYILYKNWRSPSFADNKGSRYSTVYGITFTRGYMDY
jgi:hypothetical protein